MTLKIWYHMKVHKQHNINGDINVAITGQFVDDDYAGKNDMMYISHIENYEKFAQFIRAVKTLRKKMDNVYKLRSKNEKQN